MSKLLNINNKRILLLAAHTDDVEFFAGATISKLIRNGADVYYVAFSACEESVPKQFDKNILRKEIKESIKVLNIPQENLYVLDYPVRLFPEYRQQILDDMIRFRKSINPDLVFTFSKNDTHQDHKVIYEESFRAFKKISMLGFESVYNNIISELTCFIEISEKDLENKISALRCYDSQKIRTERGVDEEYVKSMAVVRGYQCGVKLAEAFEVIRIIL